MAAAVGAGLGFGVAGALTLGDEVGLMAGLALGAVAEAAGVPSA